MDAVSQITAYLIMVVLFASMIFYIIALILIAIFVWLTLGVIFFGIGYVIEKWNARPRKPPVPNPLGMRPKSFKERLINTYEYWLFHLEFATKINFTQYAWGTSLGAVLISFAPVLTIVLPVAALDDVPGISAVWMSLGIAVVAGLVMGHLINNSVVLFNSPVVQNSSRRDRGGINLGDWM
jgi:hypothetical protein